jgi:hypothetical protein
VKITKHAQKRSQQKAIPNQVIELLLTYGEEEPAGNGASICRFQSRRTKKEIRRECRLTGFKNIEKYFRAYIIVSSDNKIVTVGHRIKRVKRDFSHVQERQNKTWH